MEGVHEAPEDFRQIVFEAGFAEEVLRGREDPDHGAASFLGLGERSRIRVVLVGAVAEERQLVEEVGRRRGGMRLGEIVGGIKSVEHGRLASCGVAAPIAAFTAITSRRRRGAAPGRHYAMPMQTLRPGRSAAEDGGRRLFWLREEAAQQPGKIVVGRRWRLEPPAARSPFEEGRRAALSKPEA